MTETSVVDQRALDALIRLQLDRVDRGETTLTQVIRRVHGDKIVEREVAPTAVDVPPLTEEHRRALKRLPEVYGRVAPNKARKLTTEEQQLLIEERDVVETVLSLLKARKETGIRETLANHLDRIAEALHGAEPADVTETHGGEEVVVKEATPRDKNGHYLLKQEEPVPGTGRKIVRQLTGGSTEISSEALHEAYQAGDLTRTEYLALTSEPAVKRVFDESKARLAIRKNPALMVKLAAHGTRVTPQSTAIYVRDHKG